ncbi:hypothetical protein GPB2148_107 [marine gamma proteobacterium HTCC2148]|nr:hypothetical protein GPB2148_107 [marine gamma proteobacterium HTCC2148]
MYAGKLLGSSNIGSRMFRYYCPGFRPWFSSVPGVMVP